MLSNRSEFKTVHTASYSFKKSLSIFLELILKCFQKLQMTQFLGSVLQLLSLQMVNESLGLRHSTHMDSVNSLNVYFVPSAVMRGARVIKMNKPKFLLWRCFQLEVMSRVNQKALTSSENLKPKYSSSHNNPRVKPLQGI